MHHTKPTIKLWRATALSGACLIVGAIVAGYFDVATRFTFEWINDYFGLFLSALLIGVVLGFVGRIGWATRVERRHRALMALVVFLISWTMLLLGLPLEGTNIHGPAALVITLILPATVLSVLLLTKAARKEGDSQNRVISRVA